jgi:hypothetical protein
LSDDSSSGSEACAGASIGVDPWSFAFLSGDLTRVKSGEQEALAPPVDAAVEGPEQPDAPCEPAPWAGEIARKVAETARAIENFIMISVG